jgi:hypothetical protein
LRIYTGVPTLRAQLPWAFDLAHFFNAAIQMFMNGIHWMRERQDVPLPLTCCTL